MRKRALVLTSLLFSALAGVVLAQSSSVTYTQTVNQAPSSVSVVSSLNPSTYGATVTFTASVPAAATGTIAFSSDGTTIGSGSVSGGTVSISTATLAVGSHAIIATYSGDSNYIASTSSTLTQVVNQATATVAESSNPNPSQFGQLVTFTAAVSGVSGMATPTGTVEFLDGANSLGTVNLNSGTALLSVSTLAVGTHSVTAVYSGDTNYSGVTSSALSQLVQLGSNLGTITQMIASPVSLSAGSTETLTALLSTGGAVPTGSIGFLNGASSLGNGSFSPVSATNLLPYSNSFANWTTVNNVASAPTVTAYAVNGPDGNLNTASTVAFPDTTASGASSFITMPVPGSAFAGKQMTLSVWLEASAAGTVTIQLTDDPQSSASQSESCPVATTWTRCTLTYAFPSSAGTGFIAYIGSVGSAAETVNMWGAQTEQAAQAGPYVATAGASATGSGISSTFTSTTLPVGSNSITAKYSGDSNFATSTSQPVVVTVTQATSGITLISSANPSVYGSNVTFTATVTGDSPTGTVTFKDGSTVLGTGALTSGSATFSTAALGVGSHSITAVYSGDANNVSGTSSAVSQVVSKAPLTLTVSSSANPSIYGGAVTFTVVAAGPPGTATPTGIITVTYGGTTLGTVTLTSGSGTLTTAVLPAGADQLTFTYGGDVNFTEATGTLNESVALRATSLSLTSSLLPTTDMGQTITFAASVAPAGVTGAVTLNIASSGYQTQLIALVDSNGQATWSVSELPAGTYTVSAVYSGDSNDTSSTSNSITETILTQDFSISVDGGGSIAPGQSWLGTVTVKGINGFTGAVKLSCTGDLDPSMGCRLGSASVTASQGGATAKVTVTTLGVSVTVVSGAMLPFLFGLFGPRERRRKRWAMVLVPVLGIAVVLSIVGCGALHRFVQSNGTPPGTYNVTVTGTSGTLTHKAVVQVTVK